MTCVRQSLEGVVKSDDDGLSRMAMACYDFFAARSCSAITANCFKLRRRGSNPDVKSLLLLVYKLSLLAGEAISLRSCSSEMTAS